MKTWIALLFVAVIPAHADLPYFEDGEHRGRFAVHEASRFDFVMKYTGEMTLEPKRRSKDPVAVANRIKIEYGIEEVKSDGSVVFKKTQEGSLVSDDKPSDDFDRMVFRGTSTGDAVYEVVIEPGRDGVAIGGRVVEKGSLTQHPLRFALRVVVPNVYRNFEFKDEDDQRDYKKKTRGDYLRLERTDFSKLRLDNGDIKAVEGPLWTGVGIEEIEMRLSYYEGRRFCFSADKHSALAISQGRSAGPWFEGFTLLWSADAAKDPESKARLKLWVK